MENIQGIPAANIKEYIIESRKKGIPDSAITDALVKSKWPLDIITKALEEADAAVPAVKEPPTELQQPKIHEPQPEQKQEPKADITQPQSQKEQAASKGGFSWYAVIALIFSPIPFIGLGLGMGALENIMKHRKSGIILALLAILINICIILFILWVFLNLFTVDPQNLPVVAKFFQDRFNLLP